MTKPRKDRQFRAFGICFTAGVAIMAAFAVNPILGLGVVSIVTPLTIGALAFFAR